VQSKLSLFCIVVVVAALHHFVSEKWETNGKITIAAAYENKIEKRTSQSSAFSFAVQFPLMKNPPPQTKQSQPSVRVCVLCLCVCAGHFPFSIRVVLEAGRKSFSSLLLRDFHSTSFSLL